MDNKNNIPIMENLEICCSPDAYNHVSNDKQYMMEVAKDVEAEQSGSFSQGIAPEQNATEETMDDIFVPICDYSQDEQQTRSLEDKYIWHDAPIKLLLALIEELRPKLGKSFAVKTKGKMYRIISERMVKEGYSYTPVQIENKFRGLERSYKKTMLHNRKTGRNRQIFTYESDLNRILGDKTGINPEYVLDSGNLEGASCSSAAVDNNSDTDNSVKDERSPNVFKKKIGLKEELMKKMKEISREKQHFHSKVLDFLQKKEERAQSREERAKRKLELLELLAKKIE